MKNEIKKAKNICDMKYKFKLNIFLIMKYLILVILFYDIKLL